MKKTLKLIAGILGIFSIFTLLNQVDFNLIQFAGNTGNAEQAGVHNSVNWLLIIVSLLIGAILVLIFDITHLTTKVTGKTILDWNKINAWLCLAFVVFGLAAAFWELGYHGKYVIMEEATEHAIAMNRMFIATMAITGVVFVIVQIALFYFSFTYRSREGRKATYVSHNNKLEIVWTAIPFVAMAILVLMGMKTWSDITAKSTTNPKQIEVFAYQFGWTARYPGDDKQFGEASFNYISGTNPLGLPVEREIESLVSELKADLEDLYKRKDSSNFALYYRALKEEAKTVGLTYTKDQRDALASKIEEVESGVAMEDIESAIYRKEKQIQRINQIKAAKNAKEFVFNGSTYDDVIATEIHLVKGQEVEFLFRARDVIHSAWLPHFKVQMNVVPGMQTHFRFTPIKTTAEARLEREIADYDYYLFCNKVCGSAHYNMKIKVVVETQAEYDEWMKTQGPAFVKNPIEKVEESPAETPTNDSTAITPEVAIN